MNKIPTQKENPKGLHHRFLLKKFVREKANGQPIYKKVDKDSEYFVMRLDMGGRDIEHIKACRVGINSYADAIEHHLPELAKDLKERYPII